VTDEWPLHVHAIGRYDVFCCSHVFQMVFYLNNDYKAPSNDYVHVYFSVGPLSYNESTRAWGRSGHL